VSRQIRWVTKNDGPDIMERSTASETEKETTGREGTGNIESPAHSTRETETSG
jgi:hypothetical protein